MLLVPKDATWVPLFESAVICDDRDGTIAPALHPVDPLARAQHRAWIEVASASLNQDWQLDTATPRATRPSSRPPASRWRAG